jgi:hypothetical protein
VTERILLKKRLDIAARLVLLTGAVASTGIYLSATPDEQNLLVNEFQDSKAYRHELEAYGGKLSVVSDELTRWFSSLWQGENLAFTVAFVSIAVALLLFWSSRQISANLPDQTGDITDSESKG